MSGRGGRGGGRGSGRGGGRERGGDGRRGDEALEEGSAVGLDNDGGARLVRGLEGRGGAEKEGEDGLLHVCLKWGQRRQFREIGGPGEAVKLVARERAVAWRVRAVERAPVGPRAARR